MQQWLADLDQIHQLALQTSHVHMTTPSMNRMHVTAKPYSKVTQLNVIHFIPRIRPLATHTAVGNFHTGTTEGTMVIIKICCWTLSKLFHVQQPISVNLFIKHFEKMTLTHLSRFSSFYTNQIFNITAKRWSFDFIQSQSKTLHIQPI